MRQAEVRGYKEFTLEIDCSNLVKRINGERTVGDWMSEVIIKDVLKMRKNFRSITVRWIHRRGNLAANYLAKNVAWRVCPVSWELNPLPSLAKILVDDVSRVGGMMAGIPGETTDSEGIG